MKQVLLSGILAILSIVYAQAQDYNPLLQTDATWRVAYTGCGTMVIDTYVSQADTIIGGQSYKIANEIIPYYVREDVATKQVYRYSTALQAELLLYDFNLEAGDTFDLAIEQWDSSTIVYQSLIDSVGQVQLEDGTWRKQIFLTQQATAIDPSTYSYSWIEGIGCSSLNVFSYSPHESASFLACYKLKGQTLWNEPYFSIYCEDIPNNPEVILGVDNSEIPTSTENIIQASPNPSSNFWTIAASNEFIPQNTMHLYSIHGQRIRTYNWEGQSIVIDNSDLEVGMYLLQSINIDNKKSSMLRLIKQ